AENPDMIAVLAGFGDKGGNFVCVCGKDAVAKGAHAGKIIQKVTAVTGGKGGGRPDSAMSGMGDTAKVDEALEAVGKIVAEFVK
ncbi:MAG: DHHA1 domain-containing protein, partial [Oscillospiraceae bacterium]